MKNMPKEKRRACPSNRKKVSIFEEKKTTN
jgi:hypothetical protein